MGRKELLSELLKRVDDTENATNDELKLWIKDFKVRILDQEEGNIHPVVLESVELYARAITQITGHGLQRHIHRSGKRSIAPTRTSVPGKILEAYASLVNVVKKRNEEE